MINLLKNYHKHLSTSSQLTGYIRRGKHRPQTKLQIGTDVYGFELKTHEHYPDFDITHRKFTNINTATAFHQLQCSQQTNTMSMIFKLHTLPFPSINYALQKMLNGGSHRYPIRNLIQTAKPYTFNNVLYTSTINEDYLMFNFSSPILTDYKHLFHLYCDMLFRPLLRKEDFDQLVWRYHIDHNNKRRLVLKGELADVLAENDYYQQNYIYRELVKTFFNRPNATICPQEELVNFTYDHLVEFYRQTINLQNLTLINHGDMSHEYILSLWNEFSSNQQANTTKKTPTFIVDSQSKPSTLQQSQPQPNSTETLPKTVTFEHMKPQTIFMLSFKINHASQEQKTLLSILSYLLFDMPESPFMKFNTPETPYPLLYGFKNRYFCIKFRYFNLGITFNDLAVSERKFTDSERQKLMLQKQQEIFKTLEQICNKKLPDSLIEKCLAHLESNYHTSDGLKIIQSIIDPVISGQPIKPALNVTQLIQKLFKKYRKDAVFENLANKFFLQNKQYICFRGYNNYQVVENKEFQRQAILGQIQKTLSEEAVLKILKYQPPNILQDLKVLPELRPLDLEFFEDLQPELQTIDNVNIFYQKRPSGISVTLKSDISDLSEELFPFLELFCRAFPQMGTKHMKDEAYQEILSRFINNISLRYQTQKSRKNPNQMKVHLFMTVDFNDRYFEYGFSVLSGLVKGWNNANIFALSKIIQKSASECFHQISQDVVSFHAKHLAGSKSPFAFFESPIFNSRSITGMAGDLRRVTNPKEILNGISYQLGAINEMVFEKARVEVMFECMEEKREFYRKYLGMVVKQLSKTEDSGVQGITVENFPSQRWLKYFPNFEQQLVFECFKFPYLQKQSAAGLLLSSMVNNNIQQYSKVGGSFLYKGTMVSFIAGGRRKVLELEEYYRKLDGLDQAKRDLFKRFGRYSVKEWFESGVSIEEARYFKQAIIATEKGEVEEVLNQYVLDVLKKGESSILSLGPRVENYEPLLKKGWQIERPVDDLSLNLDFPEAITVYQGLLIKEYQKLKQRLYQS